MVGQRRRGKQDQRGGGGIIRVAPISSDARGGELNTQVGMLEVPTLSLLQIIDRQVTNDDGHF